MERKTLIKVDIMYLTSFSNICPLIRPVKIMLIWSIKWHGVEAFVFDRCGKVWLLSSSRVSVDHKAKCSRATATDYTQNLPYIAVLVKGILAYFCSSYSYSCKTILLVATSCNSSYMHMECCGGNAHEDWVVPPQYNTLCAEVTSEEKWPRL